MARMVRKQVYIEKRQDELLERRARELGVSEAELVRRGIDQVCGVAIPASRRWWSAPDPNAWEREKEYIRKHRSGPVPQTKDRGWTREELYDERLGKFGPSTR